MLPSNGLLILRLLKNGCEGGGAGFVEQGGKERLREGRKVICWWDVAMSEIEACRGVVGGRGRYRHRRG